ncbi:MAG: hypothetical protein ACLSAH_15040 [Bilophila wadsworthia]
MAEMKKNGCYLVTGEDREKLKNHMWKPNAKGKIALNPDIIAKSAQVIDGAGISIPKARTSSLSKAWNPSSATSSTTRRSPPSSPSTRPRISGRLPYPRRTDQPRRAATPAASIPTSTSTSSSSAST